MSEKAPIEITVEHQQDKQRFVIPVDGHEAVLEYRLTGQHIDFSRTFVPDELRGKGLAERLVRHGLKWAKAQDYEIAASCWYVQKFLK
ncbi:N-acetyltransferase [Shewanella xiamenensis]|uniref:GNAT family N-acetyltransferase n=1 Tax=Shewanella xiamenensis TaxID=332186 RepID=UPI00214FA43A|nr:GNAT family N-acetyltransferase [Shewanella xiamenensis]MCR4534007.1 N-acetyltransferase [Shewanella xiamenensis]WHF55808.1 N-acetyltransferase [Shewanella xiamenensis]